MQWLRYICSGACTNNVKCMYICVPGHIGDCIVCASTGAGINVMCH